MKCDFIICARCGEYTETAVKGMCIGCYNDAPKTLEEQMQFIISQLDKIMARIDGINDKLNNQN